MELEQLIQMVITIFCSVVASSGFWAYMDKRASKKDGKAKMLLGLGHDRLLYLCLKYLQRGSITGDELENLEYLFVPYEELKGNGTVSKLMIRINNLPITRGIYDKKEENIS